MRKLIPLIFFLVFSSVGFCQVVVNYDSNQTVELTVPRNVTISFFNNDTGEANVTFGTPEQWLSVNETFFFLNTTNSTKWHNSTVTILMETYLGNFVRKIPYSINDYNYYLYFYLNAIEPITKLSVDVFTTEFEIEPGDVDSGALRVLNNHTFPAWNLRFWDSKGWMDFNKNNLTLEANHSETILFTIEPRINYTYQTNTTHNITLYVGASNVNVSEYNISVFVPYMFMGNGTCDYFREQALMFEAKQEFCSNFPSSPECLSEPYYVEVNKTQYVKTPCISNMSEEEANLYHVTLQILNITQRQLDACHSNLANASEAADECNRLASESSIKLDRLGGGEQFMLIVLGCFSIIGILFTIITIVKKIRG